MRKKTSLKDIAVIGLALFAMCRQLYLPPLPWYKCRERVVHRVYVLLYRGRWSGSGCHPLHD